MNEELQTVNAELKSKLESISRRTATCENLIAATEIGTLFLDPKLRIRMFTPPVADIFNVAEADVGRHDHRLHAPAGLRRPGARTRAGAARC